LLTDLHQHLWTEPLIEALGARSSLPFVRRTRGVTMLHSAAELPYVIDLETEAPARRAGLLRADGVDRAVVALSSPIGIEALDRAGALELIGAHLEGVRALPEEFLAWGPIPLDGLDPDDVDRVLGPRCAGVSLPAAALAGHEALADCRPVLARIAELGVPLFVHPGPAPGTPRVQASLTEPLWWRALTDYVAQMQAAWFTFVTLGRRELPQLEVVFAMLAGGAPLLSERLTARGGPQIDLYDPLIFYDTSSYGPAAVEAIARRVGAEQLVYGSDRPVIEPMLTGRELLLAANGSRLVDRSGVAV
jgi:predicted TIM-barrel fold metal-dependent hydrolase